MAMYYSLVAECGNNEKNYQRFAEHFCGLELKLKRGLSTHCRTGSHQDCEGNWWVVVSPYGISYASPFGDVEEFRNDEITKEVSFYLYEKLKTSPDFRYAIAGWEVDDFRYFSELDGDIIHFDFNGLVISQDIWQQFERPNIFLPFREGYYWRPIHF